MKRVSRPLRLSGIPGGGVCPKDKRPVPKLESVFPTSTCPITPAAGFAFTKIAARQLLADRLRKGVLRLTTDKAYTAAKKKTKEEREEARRFVA